MIATVSHHPEDITCNTLKTYSSLLPYLVTAVLVPLVGECCASSRSVGAS